MSLLKVENLSAGYGKKEVIKDLSFDINNGQMVGIIGPNGCGKSTFMKAICKGISYHGNVILEGENVQALSEKELAKRCSYVPQKSGLSIDITVLDVALMGFHPKLGMLEGPSAKMRNRAKDILTQVGLGDEIFSNYMELSEGQKRLCILARSLVANTKLLLMDEPDAFLDFSVRNTLLQIVQKLVCERSAGVLLTLHDTNLALSYCDCIYLMKEGSFVDVIHPKRDSVEELEGKLSNLYGAVRILEHKKENGEKIFVMVQV